MRQALLNGVLVLALATPAMATVFNPKVTTDTSIDCTSRETILRDIVRPGMSDEEKAIAVWRFVRSHIYHYAHIDRQPLRQINNYGYCLCGSQACVTKAVCLNGRTSQGIRAAAVAASWYFSSPVSP